MLGGPCQRRRREAHHDPATGCCPTSWELGAEAERRRIASELHDRVAPTMAALGLELDRLRRHASDEELRPGLERMRDDVRTAMVEVREVLGDLRRVAPPASPPAAEEPAPRNGRGRRLHAVPGPGLRGDPAGRR